MLSCIFTLYVSLLSFIKNENLDSCDLKHVIVVVRVFGVSDEPSYVGVRTRTYCTTLLTWFMVILQAGFLLRIPVMSSMQSALSRPVGRSNLPSRIACFRAATVEP